MRAICGAGVHDDPVVNDGPHAVKASADDRCFVLHDHAQTDAELVQIHKSFGKGKKRMTAIVASTGGQKMLMRLSFMQKSFFDSSVCKEKFNNYELFAKK